MTLTDDLDLNAKDTSYNMKAVSFTIQRLWPILKVFEAKHSDR